MIVQPHAVPWMAAQERTNMMVQLHAVQGMAPSPGPITLGQARALVM